MGKVKPFYFVYNYEGIDEKKGQLIVQPSAARLIKNLHRDANGELSAYNQGYDNFTDELESGARVDALYQYTSEAGTDYLLCAVNGKIKNLNTETGAITSEISTGFTANKPVDFETFKGSVYAVSETLNPQKWAGSGNMSAAGGWPITNGSEQYDYPSIVELHCNRLCFANFHGATDYPSHLVVSNDLAPETFTFTAGTETNGFVAQVSPGDGQEITAMRSVDIPALGLTYLVIWKNKSISVLEGDAQSSFAIRSINRKFGCLNNRCVVQVGTDFIFMDDKNIYSLTTATQSGTLQPKVIGSDKVKDTLQTLNLAQKSKAWALYVEDRNEVWFGIPTGSSTEVDKILVYAMPRDKDEDHFWIVRDGFPSKPTCAAMLNRTFLTGAVNGYVNEWFGSSTYAGTGINYRIVYPYYDFGALGQYKNVKDLYAWFLLIGTESVSFTTEWRVGGSRNARTTSRTISQTAGDALYGAVTPPAGVYGTSTYSVEGGVLTVVQLPCKGNGAQLQLTMSGTTDDTGPISWVSRAGLSSEISLANIDRGIGDCRRSLG